METVQDLMTPNPLVVSPSTPLAACARMMARLNLRHLPVVEPEGRILGVLTDWILFARGGLAGDGAEVWVPFPGCEAETVQDLPLGELPCTHLNTPLTQALRLLTEGRNEALLVTDPPEVPVGILTEHDGVRLAAGLLPKETRVSDVATHAPFQVSPAEPVEGLLDRLAERGIRHLIVTENNQLAGVLSARDIITANLGGRANPRVRDILVRHEVVHVLPSTPMFEAAALMVRRHIGCLPLLSSRGAPVGILTRRDVLRSCAAALEEQALFGDAKGSGL